MKATTKILIGTGAGLFLLLVIGLVALALLGGNARNYYVIDWSHMARHQLSRAKYLVVSAENVLNMAQLTVLPLPEDTAEPYLELPAALEPYFSIESRGDTLRLFLHDLSPLAGRHGAHSIAGVIGATLCWPGELPDEIDSRGGMSLVFAGVRADKPLLFRGNGASVLLDSCRFAGIRRLGNARLVLENSRVDTLALRLSGNTSWQMSDSRIGVLRLSGDEQVYCDITGMAVDKVEWLPESGKARLRFNLDGKPADIVYKDQ